MKESAHSRTKLQLANDMLVTTKQMMQNLDDADFLIKGIEKRQSLMDAFDQASEKEVPSPASTQMLKTIFTDIKQMDTAITAALLQLRKQTKARLSNSNQQQKVLGYTNHAMSASGSYMDYRK